MRKTEISHFYLGRVEDSSRYLAFLKERYDREEDEPLSGFYGSQGELFCDHDFMETGARDPGASLEAFFAPHSYSDQWSTAVCRAARAIQIEDADVLIFISATEIESPRSVKSDGFELIYIGPFEYQI
jgi:hypothetical protein